MAKTTSPIQGNRHSNRKIRHPNYYTSSLPIVHHRTKKAAKCKAGNCRNASVKVNAIKKKSSLSAKQKTKSAKKAKDKKPPKEKTPRVKRHANDKLTPRPTVTIYSVNPTFESTNPIPFVSNESYSKLVLRAVKLGKKELLNRLIKDRTHVCSLAVNQSVNVQLDGPTTALLNSDFDLFDTMMKNMVHNSPMQKGRVQPITSLLEKMGTGQANFYMLGHATRAIGVSRGGKEGNNAFLKDSVTQDSYWQQKIDLLLRNDVPYEILQRLIQKKYITEYTINQKIYEAVRWGNRKLAGKLIESFKPYGFNELHRKVLLNDKQGLGDFKAISVKKKAVNNRDFTPLHGACINPNVKHLEALINAEPDFNHADVDNWRATHYAAACERADPLEFLLNKGASPFDVNKKGYTPLHVAAVVGRLENVKLLMKKLKENDPAMSAINQKNRKGFTALHLAALKGHMEIVRTMIDAGAKVDIQTGAAVGKLTPLDLACQRGHLEVIKVLIDEGKSVIDKKDKLKRTALTHAIIDGQAHVTSYLLRRGASMDIPDTSGNTNVHYAAAYGWYFNMKLLIEAGADMNATNDWQVTPLAVAYMKGHMGLADLILQQPGIDINCRDDKGMTLLALTLSTGVNQSTIGQLEYLIFQKNADCSIKDTYGNNVLHHLAVASVLIPSEVKQNLTFKKAQDLMIEVAEFLKAHSTIETLSSENDSGLSPFDLAIIQQTKETSRMRSVYSALAEFLYKNKCDITVNAEQIISDKSNIMHHLFKTCHSSLCLSTLKLMGMRQRKEVNQLLKMSDENGATPFLALLKYYWTFSCSETSEETQEMYDNMQKVIEYVMDQFPFVLQQTMGQKTVVTNSLVDEPMEDDEDENEDEDMESDDEDRDSGIQTNGFDATKSSKTTSSEESSNVFHLCFLRGNQPEKSTKPLLKLLIEAVQRNKYKSVIDKYAVYDGESVTPLILAVNNGMPQFAEQLITAGADVNLPSIKQKKTEEKQEAKRNDVSGKVWRKLTKSGKKTSGNESDTDRITPLMYAAQNKLFSVVKLLISVGAEIGQTDSIKNTALHYASTDSSREMVEIASLLIMSKINVNHLNENKRSALHISCNSDCGSVDVSTEMVELLINSGASMTSTDIRGRNPLHYVFIKIGNHTDSSAVDPIAICSVVLKHNTDQKNPSLVVPDAFGQTPLHCAAKRGANISCMTMLRHCSQNEMDMEDQEGNSALGLAVFFQHKACTLTLLQANASLKSDVKTNNLGVNEIEKWEKLMAWVWQPHQTEKPGDGIITIPDSVVKNEWQGVVYVILDLMSTQKDAAYNLVSAALYFERYNLALTLLRIAQSSSSGVAKYEHSNKKNLFTILAETKPNATTTNLSLAVANALHVAGVRFVTNNASRPMIEAAKNHNFELLKFFLKNNPKGASSLKSIQYGGHSCLSACFERSFQPQGITQVFVDICTEAIFQGVDVNECNTYRTQFLPTDVSGIPIKMKDGENGIQDTLLIRAIKMQNFSLCKFLLKDAKVDAETTNPDGVTPLMFAVRCNNSNIVKLLLDIDYEIIGDDGEPVRNKQAFTAPKRLFLTSNHGPKPIQSQFSGSQEDGSESEGSEDRDVEMDDDTEDFAPTSAKRRKRKLLTSKKKKLTSPNKSTTVKFKSGIDLDAVDTSGWSVIHHAVMSLSLGGWENREIITFLAKHGARVDLSNKSNQTPLDLAKQSGQKEAAKLLIDLIKSNIKHVVCPGIKFLVTAKCLVTKVDIDADSEAYIKQIADERKKKGDDAKSKANALAAKYKPYKMSSYLESGKLCECPATGRVFSVLLNKVDLKYGLYGFYNFYRLQLIQRKGTNLHIVFTNWGRIGDVGQYQHTAFGSFEDGLKEFSSIFRQKTGNLWTDINHFKQMPRKYKLIEIEEESLEASNITEIDIGLESTVKTKLDTKTAAMLRNISNVDALKRNTKSLQSIGRFVQPFGKLKKSIIMDARVKLVEIAELVRNLEKMQRSNDKNLDKGERIMNSLNDLSNEFYQLMPIGGFEQSLLPVINSSNYVSNYLTVIDNLLQFEVAGKIVTAAATKKEIMNPLDYIYAALNCVIEPMEPDSDECQHILHYIANAEQSPQIKCIFKVYNERQENNFNAKSLDNCRLLWHGTNSVNLLSILKLGLMAAPPTAMHHGFLFGKGIYTSDSLGKSVGYCQSNVDGVKYALLAEVALGKMNSTRYLHNLDITDPLPKGCNSNVGMGREIPDPQYDLTMPYGYKIPLGKMVARPQDNQNPWYYDLSHNEYIVYDPSQIIVRYIVAFK